MGPLSGFDPPTQCRENTRYLSTIMVSFYDNLDLCRTGVWSQWSGLFKLGCFDALRLFGDVKAGICPTDETTN